MKAKLSVMATAMAFTLFGTANAATWIDAPESAEKWSASELSQQNQDSIYRETLTGDISYTSDASGYVHAISQISDSNLISTNNGRLWVTLDREKGADHASAFVVAGENSTAINNGSIYLKGDLNQGASFTHAFSLGAPNVTGINNGTIVADAAVAFTVNSNTNGSINNATITNSASGDILAINGGIGIEVDHDSSQASIQNEGKISAQNNGYGIYISGQSKNNQIENTGTIIVEDSSSVGVYFFNTTLNQFTNSGTIIAEDGYAIKFDAASGQRTKDNSVTLEGNSHIEGIVQLTSGTTLNIQNLTNHEILELKVVNNQNSNQNGALSQANIENSHITFKQVENSGEALRFDKVNFKGDSYFGVAEGSSVKIKGEIKAEDGAANFEARDLGQIDINTDPGKATVAENTTINTHYVGGTVSDKLASGEITLSDIANDSIQGQFKNDTDEIVGGQVEVEAGYIGDEILLNYGADSSASDFDVVKVVENQLTQSNIALAKLNAIAWRNELNTLTDRMSTLRTAPEFAGTWVRYKGGEWDGDGINQQFNGVELGVDKTIGQNFLVGLSASYINGDGDLDNGSADTDNYSGAAYLSYFNSGWFVDVMGKIGKIETDFDLSYNGLKDSGDYTMSGYLVGVETGYRFNFNNFFVEPQVQLTYSYLGGKEFSTDNRTIDFETIESMIGRVGFMSGYDFGDIGSAYLRASYYHDFEGDVDMRVGHNDLFVTESDELDSDWGDIGVGANVTFGGATLFFDVSRSYGGDIDMEWKANAGARYNF
ncbi:autotransporter outer membrane beta-barrel domain-containing protein [Succinatimonas hippei]|uniref:Outer membrane autotransporter barrel domain protein n=1 Tax=Succinatimonas hippei (strain DSM 22608 / JCM 16073 / KCTC 15190 / YIT 12066) TaxID=762983 RepID=E8LKK8_SUCHY|nr:autotransporter outer membrane beta-barrel domain-containing protein [Succinatimonas hippei]EFY06936.1 outer membrane autotransporter barrel domain protein [Succinatimonas hippei YIT 12066]